MNDLLNSNYFSNSGVLPQFLEKNNLNNDYFFNTNGLNTGGVLPQLESNFFPNFPNNINSTNIQNNPLMLSNNNEMINQNNIFLANNNFLLNNNLGNPSNINNLYEDLVKNPAADLWYQGTGAGAYQGLGTGAYQTGANQFNFSEKNFLNTNMFGENGSGLLGKQSINSQPSSYL